MRVGFTLNGTMAQTMHITFSSTRCESSRIFACQIKPPKEIPAVATLHKQKTTDKPAPMQCFFFIWLFSGCSPASVKRRFKSKQSFTVLKN